MYRKRVVVGNEIRRERQLKRCFGQRFLKSSCPVLRSVAVRRWGRVGALGPSSSPSLPPGSASWGLRRAERRSLVRGCCQKVSLVLWVRFTTGFKLAFGPLFVSFSLRPFARVAIDLRLNNIFKKGSRGIMKEEGALP